MKIEEAKEGIDVDRLVARHIMEWDVNFVEPGFRGGRVHWRDAENSTCYLPGQWSPSMNIVDAMQAAEKFDRGFILSRGNAQAWNVDFYPKLDTVTAETPELTITLGLLKAAGVLA